MRNQKESAIRGYRIAIWLLIFAAIVSTSCRRRDEDDPQKSSVEALQPETLRLTGNGLKLKTEIFRGANVTSRPVLAIVLHGDSPFHPPSYQYLFAREAAEQIPNAIFVAILRPGYTDDTGEKSEGVRGLTTGDNYTPQDVDAIAQVIRQLKERFHPAATVLIGHSGGAAISADILGRAPQLVNGALLVSCPCDLPKFRQHMMSLQQNNPIWIQPIESLSPVDLADKVSRLAIVRMLVGSKDDIAPPGLTQEYARDLEAHGVNVTVTIAPGLPHDILLEPIAYEQTKALIADVCRAAP